MRFLLAAVGGTLAALVESTVVPHLTVNGAHPHVVLVLGIVWTVAAGVETGLVWGFAGGLALDAFAQRPLGSTAFVLVAVLGVAGLLARAFSRSRPMAPVPLTFVLSLASSILLLVVYGALERPIPDPQPVRTLLPGVIYDTVLAAAIGPLVVSLLDRRSVEERTEW